MKSPSLAIVGCGDIGTRVGARLIPLGWEVCGIRRSPEKLPDSLQPLAGDYTQPGGLAAATGLDPDFVLFTPIPSSHDEAGYRASYPDALDQLLEADLCGKDRCGILVSTTRVYGATAGEWVDETSPLTDSDGAALAIIEAEKRMAERFGRSSVLRASGVYGGLPGMLLDRVAAGSCSPDPERLSNRIHQDDLARVIVHVLEAWRNGRDMPPVMVASDDEPVAIGEVEQWLAQQMAVAVAPMPAKPRGRPRGNRRCSNRLLRETGFKFDYPTFREGYGAMLAARKD